MSETEPPSSNVLPSALPEMRFGTPTLEAVDALLATDFYRQLKAYSDSFLATHDAALRGYGRFWGDDPMKLWSRRWEYPFAARSVLAHAERVGRTDLTVCDAGSGVTFLPYLLADRLAGSNYRCVDTNASYTKMFAAVNDAVGHERVHFETAAIQQLPFADDELDVMCCVSVLEHTGDYPTIIDEFARVVRPGGRLVLTFDLSLEDRFELRRDSAKAVFHALARHFDCEAETLMTEASRVYDTKGAGRLSTPEIRQRQPELLPWKYPKLQAIYDVVRGYGWTGGFRYVAPFCIDLQKHQGNLR